MPNPLKKSEIAKLLPVRDAQSHKGQNGRLLIIGGSLEYFGAPLLAAMAALHSGADLVYLLVPECNFDVSRTFAPDIIVRRYPGSHINSRTYDAALELLNKVDAILIGPGMSEDPESISVITRLLQKVHCQVVLDAEAIPAIAHVGLSGDANSRITITPHRGEMTQLIQEPLPDDIAEVPAIIEKLSHQWNVTVLLKGQTDIIAAPGRETRTNETGNAGMTVGGTGDILAGCVASFIAQHAQPYDACLAGAFVNGYTGDALFKTKGYNFIASEIAQELPYALKEIAG